LIYDAVDPTPEVVPAGDEPLSLDVFTRMWEEKALVGEGAAEVD